MSEVCNICGKVHVTTACPSSVCQHGQLKRSCDKCELEASLAAVTKESKMLESNLQHSDALFRDCQRERDALTLELSSMKRERDALKVERDELKKKFADTCEQGAGELTRVEAERDALQEKLSAVTAQRDKAHRGRLDALNHYPHMCRIDHPEIGYMDSENEQCPLCDALEQVKVARGFLESARTALATSNEDGTDNLGVAYEILNEALTKLDGASLRPQATGEKVWWMNY